MANELVEWDDLNAGEDGYRVKWGSSSGSYPDSADVGPDQTTYRIAGLIAGRIYYWIVMAIDGGVEQTPTSEQSFTARDVHIQGLMAQACC